MCEADTHEQFGLHCKKFAVYLSIPESNDALNSLSAIVNSKNRVRLPYSSLFPLLAHLAVDFQREIPDKLRRPLLDFVIKSVHDPVLRRYLQRQDFIHALTNSLVVSCSRDVCKAFVKDCAAVLCNLAYSDKLRFYIPGETIKQEKVRRKLLLWGGLIGLYYFVGNTSVREAGELCESVRNKAMSLRDYEDLLKVLKLYLGGLDDSELFTEECEVKQNSPQAREVDEEMLELEDASVPALDMAKSRDVQFPR